jgi:hypothetical protein
MGMHPGAFGTMRRHHVHEGVDLYCAEGTMVSVVERGTVVAIEHFTGARSNPPSPWWLDTKAVLVEGQSGVVLYGEVEPCPGLIVGAHLECGQVLGRVVRVLRHDKGRPVSMLHIELHTQGTRCSRPWSREREPPDSLRDPTLFLVAAAACNPEP